MLRTRALGSFVAAVVCHLGHHIGACLGCSARPALKGSPAAAAASTGAMQYVRRLMLATAGRFALAVPLQGSVNPAGQCIFPATGFINTAITGTSFATGQQVAPTIFDVDIYQDGKCYTPNNYGVLNTAAVSALHAQGDKVIGYIDAGTAETWRPDYPQYQSFNASCGGCLLGKPVGGFRDEFWLNINTNVSGTNPNTGQTETAQQFILDELALGWPRPGQRRRRDRVRQRRRTRTRQG
jgi:hypothetical protein